MPAYRVSVTVSVREFDRDYGPALASSSHFFYAEAESATEAITVARSHIEQRLPLLTVDAHERAARTAREVEAAARES